MAGLRSAYDQDMLDTEWQAMLGLVDDGLLQVIHSQSFPHHALHVRVDGLNYTSRACLCVHNQKVVLQHLSLCVTELCNWQPCLARGTWLILSSILL